MRRYSTAKCEKCVSAYITVTRGHCVHLLNIWPIFTASVSAYYSNARTLCPRITVVCRHHVCVLKLYVDIVSTYFSCTQTPCPRITVIHWHNELYADTGTKLWSSIIAFKKKLCLRITVIRGHAFFALCSGISPQIKKVFEITLACGSGPQV